MVFVLRIYKFIEESSDLSLKVMVESGANTRGVCQSCGELCGGY